MPLDKSTANGAKIIHYDDNGDDAVQWRLEPCYSGYALGKFETALSHQAQLDIDNSIQTYNSIDYNILYETYYTAAKAMVTGGARPFPDAAAMLDYFLLPPFTTMRTFTINFKDMIMENSQAKQNLIEDMNRAIAAAEAFNYEATPTLITTGSETSHTTLYNGNKLENWYLAVGGYRTWSTCSYIKMNNVYTMTVEYHMRDLYDWKANGTGELGLAQDKMNTLHKAGMARDYLVDGMVKLEVNWSRGQRINTGAKWSIIQ